MFSVFSISSLSLKLFPVILFLLFTRVWTVVRASLLRVAAIPLERIVGGHLGASNQTKITFCLLFLSLFEKFLSNTYVLPLVLGRIKRTPPSLFGTKNATEQDRGGKNRRSGGRVAFLPARSCSVALFVPNKLGGVLCIRPRTNTPQQYNKKPVKIDTGLDFLKVWRGKSKKTSGKTMGNERKNVKI